MSDRASPRWTTGTWAGLDQFRCTLCPFDTLDYGAIRNHARVAHPREWEGASLADPLARVPFASAAAEAEARTAGLSESEFTGEPTGKTGYTLADVRRFASATTPTEE